MRFTRTAAWISLALAASGCRGASEDEVSQLRAELIEVRAEQRQLREELRALGGAAPVGPRAEAGARAGSTGEAEAEGEGSPGAAAASAGSSAGSDGPAAAAPPSPTASSTAGAASTIQVPIQTDPPGAEVFVGETRTRAGVTPFVLAAPRDVEMHIRLEKEGYRPHLLNLRPTPGAELSIQLARKGR